MIAIEDIDISNIKKDIIVDKLMKSKGVYLLASQPKVGKSFFALQLSYSITNGIPILGCKTTESPVLYISTESDKEEIYKRFFFMGLPNKCQSFFIIDRNNKDKVSLIDTQVEIAEFATKSDHGLLIIDMIKDFDVGVSYDINSYQDVSERLMPKLRGIADKYNLTILLIHHLNKRNDILGSNAFRGCVDGIITLMESDKDKNKLKLISSNRDFESFELDLKRNPNLTLSICDKEDDEIDPNLILFIKYATQKKEFEFTATSIVESARIFLTPKQFGRLLNSNLSLLEREGLHITKNRTSENRTYKCVYEEPPIEDDY